MSISIGSFLTSTALLVAILLVWAQLWHNTWKIYKDRLDKDKASDGERRKIDKNVSLSLGLNYFAILLAVVAFAVTAWSGFVDGSKDIPTCAKWFLVISVVITGIQVIFSCASAFYKSFKPKPFDKPAFTIDQCIHGLKDRFRIKKTKK